LLVRHAQQRLEGLFDLAEVVVERLDDQDAQPERVSDKELVLLVLRGLGHVSLLAVGAVELGRQAAPRLHEVLGNLHRMEDSAVQVFEPV